ncbi:MAG: GNAT family N-acetyltransferase [Bacteroidota bacterium]
MSESNDKVKYINYCKDNNIPVFQEPWWLDAASGSRNWDVVLSYNGDQLAGFWPYCIKKKSGFTKITQPKLTKAVSPIILFPNDMGEAKRMSFMTDVVKDLYNKLPKFDDFSQNLDRTISSWLPWYWCGFDCMPKYTYVLEDLSDLDQIKKNFRSNLKRQIKKAEKQVSVSETDSVDTVYHLNELTFKRQNSSVPFKKNLLESIDTSCREHKARTILVAKDSEGRVHSCLYLVMDKEYMYYLLGGSDPTLRNSGAASLLLWEAMQLASGKGLKFDFEGSMIEPISRFMRSYGAKQEQYFHLSKTNNKLLRLLKALR